MGVNIFNDSIIGCKMGTDTIDAIYQGTELLYSSVPPEPKFIATYSDSTTYSAACDGTTSLTFFDVKPSGYTASAMTSAEIGDCVTSIETAAFSGCTSLKSATIGGNVTSIGYRAFYNCVSLSSITIPNSVINLDGFDNCVSLTSVDIPDSVTTIGSFGSCSGMTSLTIGSGVTTISTMAFSACRSLQSIIIRAVNPPTNGGAIFNNTNNCPIYVPIESVNAYKTAWPEYASRIQAIP